MGGLGAQLLSNEDSDDASSDNVGAGRRRLCGQCVAKDSIEVGRRKKARRVGRDWAGKELGRS